MCGRDDGGCGGECGCGVDATKVVVVWTQRGFGSDVGHSLDGGIQTSFVLVSVVLMPNSLCRRRRIECR